MPEDDTQQIVTSEGPKAELSGLDKRWLHDRSIDEWRDPSRDHPMLLKCIHELGDKANGYVTNLQVVEVPADAEWVIVADNGWEDVAVSR